MRTHECSTRSSIMAIAMHADKCSSPLPTHTRSKTWQHTITKTTHAQEHRNTNNTAPVHSAHTCALHSQTSQRVLFSSNGHTGAPRQSLLKYPQAAAPPSHCRPRPRDPVRISLCFIPSAFSGKSSVLVCGNWLRHDSIDGIAGCRHSLIHSSDSWLSLLSSLSPS